MRAPQCGLKAFRADSSESLFAMSWTDEDTGSQSPNSRAIFAAIPSAVVRSSCANEIRIAQEIASPLLAPFFSYRGFMLSPTLPHSLVF